MPLTSLAANNPGATTKKGFLDKPLLDTQKTAAMKAYNRLPLYFIKNNGQVDKSVRFYERGAGHGTFFTSDGVVLTLRSWDNKSASFKSNKTHNKVTHRKATTESVRLSFVGANKKAEITSGAAMPGHVNYFRGNDKTTWRSTWKIRPKRLYRSLRFPCLTLCYKRKSKRQNNPIFR